MSKHAVRRTLSLCGLAWLASILALAADVRISGPYTHDNLSIYLLHSTRKEADKKLLTLQEAMSQKKVVVYETGQVNQLAIENRSAEDVFIQSGDIVKGGQQDRVLSTDMVLPANSGKLPIASFCVESGRWTKRADEPARQFSLSDKALPSKPLKMAVRDQKNQVQVWAEVAEAKAKLAVASEGTAAAGGGGNVGEGAGSGVGPSDSFVQHRLSSSTSMQLALENKRVVESTAAYVRSLAKILDGKNDAVGYAYSINGKLNSAEVYASHDLFVRMWPKMLDSTAAEALSERQVGETYQAPPPLEVTSALDAADRGREVSKETAGRMSVAKKDSEKVILYEASDADRRGEWIHKSYVVK